MHPKRQTLSTEWKTNTCHNDTRRVDDMNDKMEVPEGYDEYKRMAVKLTELHFENEEEKLKGYVV